MAIELPNGSSNQKISNFKMWCQKVLPLVYDESLSYYETLCKVVEYLNLVINHTNDALEDVDVLITTYSDLKAYVEQYLNDLGIQNEIDDKLDRMVSDGTLEKLITPYVSTKINEQVKYFTDVIEKEKKKYDNFVFQQETKFEKYVGDVDVLKQRVNNLSSMPDGSTTGDAELRDIRVTAYGSTELSAGDAVRKQFMVLDSGKTDNSLYNLWERSNIRDILVNGATASQENEDGYIHLVSTTKYGAYYRYIVNNNPPIEKLLVAVKYTVDAGAVLPIEIGTICHCVMLDDRDNKTFESKSHIIDTIGEHTIVGLINIGEAYRECYKCGISILIKTKDAGVTIKDYVGFDVSNMSDELISLIAVEQLMVDGYYDRNKNVGTSTYADKAVTSIRSDKSNYAYTATNAGLGIDELPVISDDTVHGFGAYVDTMGGNIRVSSTTTYGSAYLDYDMQVNKRYCAVWTGYKFSYLSLVHKSGTGWLHSEVKSVTINDVEYHYADIEPIADYSTKALYWNNVDNANVSFKPIVITEIPANAVINSKYIEFILEGGMLDIVSELNSLKNKWFGKKVLFIGDSLTEANVYQKTVTDILDVETSNVAYGGYAIQNVVNALAPKNVQDVDLIVLYGGYNNRHNLVGKVGDVYNSNGTGEKTVAGYMQYSINKIYECLKAIGNLTCKLLIVTVDCAGKYEYIDADGYEEYPKGSGQNMETIANIQKAVAEANGIPCCDLWHNSGINKRTWDVYGAKQTAVNEMYSPYQLDANGNPVSDVRITYRNGDSYYQFRDGNVVLEQYNGNVPHPYNNDQLHKSTNGYKLIGECIAGAIISAYGR